MKPDPPELPAIWTTVSQAREAVAVADPLVLVPTMGDLHEGHLDLVRAATTVGSTAVSIFVNPTQFAPGEDFERYPRRLEDDAVKLTPLGVHGIFAPGVQEMYPPGDSTRVEISGLTGPLCGQHREGHFLGVTTVCTKLFAALSPKVAVFGQKDAQQCLVMHRLVTDLHLNVDLVFIPTRREPDGLAMSSRNRYLQAEDRVKARALSQALERGRELLQLGERDCAMIQAQVAAVLESCGARPDYAELRAVPDLQPRDRAAGRMILAVAARVGGARLIDNLCFEIDADRALEAPLLDDHTLEAAQRRWAR